MFFFSALIVNAQSTPTKNVLNEASVVRGEDGMVYPYAVWRKLMQSGKYAIKNRKTVTDSGKPEYLIYEMNDEQKVAYFNRMPKPKPSDSFKEEDEFKGFKVTDINGNKFDLKAAKDKVIVLNFWFINCPPCREEIPQLNELVAEYKDNPDVIFLAIATDAKYELKNFLKSNPYAYNVVDGGRYIADKFNVRLYPTHVVVSNGKIKFSTVGLGPNTVHWIKKSVDEALTK